MTVYKHVFRVEVLNTDPDYSPEDDGADGVEDIASEQTKSLSKINTIAVLESQVETEVQRMGFGPNVFTQEEKEGEDESSG